MKIFCIQLPRQNLDQQKIVTGLCQKFGDPVLVKVIKSVTGLCFNRGFIVIFSYPNQEGNKILYRNWLGIIGIKLFYSPQFLPYSYEVLNTDVAIEKIEQNL